jgi:hypothetical protein
MLRESARDEIPQTGYSTRAPARMEGNRGRALDDRNKVGTRPEMQDRQGYENCYSTDEKTRTTNSVCRCVSVFMKMRLR